MVIAIKPKVKDDVDFARAAMLFFVPKEILCIFRRSLSTP
jgi:hypothetical protein